MFVYEGTIPSLSASLIKRCFVFMAATCHCKPSSISSASLVPSHSPHLSLSIIMIILNCNSFYIDGVNLTAEFEKLRSAALTDDERSEMIKTLQLPAHSFNICRQVVVSLRKEGAAVF